MLRAVTQKETRLRIFLLCFLCELRLQRFDVFVTQLKISLESFCVFQKTVQHRYVFLHYGAVGLKQRGLILL